MCKLDLFASLLEALEDHDLAKLTFLLSKQPSRAVINQVDEDGSTLLHIAASEGHHGMTTALIRAGAAVNTLNQGGNSALHVALYNYEYDVARALIAAGDVNLANQCSRTPLHIAASNGQAFLVLALIEASASLNLVDEDGRTPLHVAVAHDHAEVARIFMHAGARVNTQDENGHSPLMTAVNEACWDCVRLLLDAKADISVLDNNENSVLDHLLGTFSTTHTPSTISRMFTLLTDAGATVDGATAKISPLVPSDVIRAIVPEDTPFWLAANNDAPMLAAELAGGLDPNMMTENGMTLLHWACAGDAPECVQLLLDAGAGKRAGDPTNQDLEDEESVSDASEDSDDEYDDYDHEYDEAVRAPEPIFYCMHESSSCLENMISVDFDVKVKIEHKKCGFRLPIHFALAANSPACVTALVGAGAWVTKGDNSEDISYPPLKVCLMMRLVPVDALRALLAAAGERVLSEKIDRMPPLYLAVKNSTVDGVRALVEDGVYKTNKNVQYTLALEIVEDLVERCSTPRDRSLTAIVDYLKSIIE